MSQFVFGGLNVHDENGPRRGKGMATRSAAAPGQKRAALGVITNQVNQQVRVQPSRAVKPKGSEVLGQDENAISKKNAKTFDAPPQGPFSIYVDEPPKAREAKQPTRTQKISLNDSTELTDAVTNLPARVPLATAASPDIICLEDSLESPMVLDVSHEESVEKKPLDREAVILSVPEYEEDIYSYLRTAELKHRPKPGYMKKQQDITNSMRTILVDWLVEVAEEYKLHRETLFLAVNYIDRFLSQMSVLRGKLQLVGAASMFLASKYEEIYPPDVSEFAYITDDTYTKKQVLRMEHLILKVLSFDVAVPTTNWFCESFLNHCGADDRLKSLAMFLCELTLVDMDTYIKYLPSVVAASAVSLARYCLNMDPWPKTLAKKTGYDVGHFVECLTELHKTYSNAEKHQQQAVMDKYKVDKYQNVSDFSKYSPPSSLPLLFDS